MNSNIIDIKNSQIVFNAFRTLHNRGEISEFMINYFKNFIVTKARPADLKFDKALDEVNDELLFPLNRYLEKRKDKVLKNDEKLKVQIWELAHQDFEKFVRIELVKLI